MSYLRLNDTIFLINAHKNLKLKIIRWTKFSVAANEIIYKIDPGVPESNFNQLWEMYTDLIPRDNRQILKPCTILLEF